MAPAIIGRRNWPNLRLGAHIGAARAEVLRLRHGLRGVSKLRRQVGAVSDQHACRSLAGEWRKAVMSDPESVAQAQREFWNSARTRPWVTEQARIDRLMADVPRPH